MDDEGPNDREPPLPTFQSALRTILLEDPAAIERLPRLRAERLDRLLDANGLQPVLYHTLRKENREGALSGARLAAWKGSYLLALARGSAFAAARREIADIVAEKGIPIRLVREAHMAFRVHPKPELRPLREIEIQVPALEAREVLSALKSRRFFAVEPLERAPPARVRVHLVGREGVLVKLRAGPSLEHPAPWDPFPARTTDFSRPIALGAEAALILHAHEMARRGFCHSLALLHDVLVLLSRATPSWSQVLSLAAGSGTLGPVYLALTILREVFGKEIDAGFLGEAETLLGLPSPNADLLRALCLSAILQHPASARLARFIESSLESERVEPAASI
jgi:hypothetical protein